MATMIRSDHFADLDQMDQGLEPPGVDCSEEYDALRTGTALNQAPMERQNNGLYAAVNLQFLQDTLNMILDGDGADVESLADGLRAHALGEMAEDCMFTAGQGN